jgi:hypothetical protein
VRFVVLINQSHWRLEAERFSGAFVQPPRDGIELALSDIRQIHPFREVLAQQAISVLVGTTLPTEIDIAAVAVFRRSLRESRQSRDGNDQKD